MKTIHKYKLQVTDEQTVEMPRYSNILSVTVQDDEPFLYALVNDELDMKKVKLSTYGTGNEVKSTHREYIGTYQLKSGFVGHLFLSL